MLNNPFSRKQKTQEALSEGAKPTRRKAHVLVVGNEKGGCGKTTTSMHLVISLLRLGFSVGTVDIDSRQRSLTRYLENRRNLMQKEGQSLPMPHHVVIQRSPFHSVEEIEADEKERFLKGLSRVIYNCDFVLIDGPGNDTYLSRLAHSFADTVITPINDSFIDLDVLANVDGETMEILRPSIYSEMLWEQKLKRAKRDGRSMEWIVMRNRLSNLDARNKRMMEKVVAALSRRIGFRLAPGFSERVIYRDMFLQGLTVLDVIDMSENRKITMSHIAARQEVRELLKTLKIPEVDRRIQEQDKKEQSDDQATASPSHGNVRKTSDTKASAAATDFAPAAAELKNNASMAEKDMAATVGAQSSPPVSGHTKSANKSDVTTPTNSSTMVSPRLFARTVSS